TRTPSVARTLTTRVVVVASRSTSSPEPGPAPPTTGAARERLDLDPPWTHGRTTVPDVHPAPGRPRGATHRRWLRPRAVPGLVPERPHRSRHPRRGGLVGAQRSQPTPRGPQAPQ